MHWNAQPHNWQMQENQTGISTDNCSNVRIKSSARNNHHPPSHKLKNYSMWSILQEKVNKTQWSRRPQTLHQNWVSQAGSHCHCCSSASVTVSGVDVFQFVWKWVAVISSTAFNSDIQTVVCWYSGLIFLQLSVMTLCTLIHDDRLIHKVK